MLDQSNPEISVIFEECPELVELSGSLHILLIFLDDSISQTGSCKILKNLDESVKSVISMSTTIYIEDVFGVKVRIICISIDTFCQCRHSQNASLCKI